MLNVTYKPFALNVDMLSVIRLNVVMLSVVAPCVVTRLSTLKRMVKNQKSCKKNFENDAAK